jgi:hypothetical protein
MTSILFDPASDFIGYTQNALDVGVWSLSSTHLVIVVNLAWPNATIDLSSIANGDRTPVLTSGVREHGSMATFDGFGSAAWLIQDTKPLLLPQLESVITESWPRDPRVGMSWEEL